MAKISLQGDVNKAGAWIPYAKNKLARLKESMSQSDRHYDYKTEPLSDGGSITVESTKSFNVSIDKIIINSGKLMIPRVFVVDHYAMYLYGGGSSAFQSGLSLYNRSAIKRLYKGKEPIDVADTLYHMHCANYKNEIFITSWDGELHRHDRKGKRQYDYIYSLTGHGVNYNLTRAAYQVTPTININYTGWHQVTINKNGICCSTGPNVGYYIFDLNQIVEGPWEYGKYTYKCLRKISTLVGPGGVHLTDNNKLYLAINYLYNYGGEWRYNPSLYRFNALTGVVEKGPVSVGVNSYIEDLCFYGDTVYLSDPSSFYNYDASQIPRLHRYTSELVKIDSWDLSNLGIASFPKMYTPGVITPFSSRGISVNKDGIWFSGTNLPTYGYDAFKLSPDNARSHLVHLDFDYSLKKIAGDVGWHMASGFTPSDKNGDFYYPLGCDTLHEEGM